MRTDDVAQRIEYVVGAKWTPEQYRRVCGVLRDYRHHSIMAIIDRAISTDDDTKDQVEK